MIKNAITIFGFILLLVLGYYLFFLDTDGLSTNDALVANQAEAQTREFLRRLNELKTIKLDTEVLRDARFNSLVDYQTEVTPVPVGRTNPFAPTN